jgi:transposase
MKNYLFYVRIYISKSKLDVVILQKNTFLVSNHFIIENNVKGIKVILKNLIKQKIDLTSVLFCC